MIRYFLYYSNSEMMEWDLIEVDEKESQEIFNEYKNSGNYNDVRIIKGEIIQDYWEEQ